MLRVVPSFGLHLGVPVAATGMSGDQEKQPVEISPEPKALIKFDINMYFCGDHYYLMKHKN